MLKLLAWWVTNLTILFIFCSSLEEVPVGGNKNQLLSNPSSASGGYNLDKIIEPSPQASSTATLLPCPICDRTFMQTALERHIKICQKVGTRKRNEPAAVRTPKTERRNLSNAGQAEPKAKPRRALVKAEDEFKPCPHCQRKFGPKVWKTNIIISFLTCPSLIILAYPVYKDIIHKFIT